MAAAEYISSVQIWNCMSNTISHFASSRFPNPELLSHRTFLAVFFLPHPTTHNEELYLEMEELMIEER